MTFVSTRAGGSSSGSAITAPAVALPGSPTNGQTAVLTDSLAAPTYQWLLMFDTSIAGASKWRYIGGYPALVVIATDEGTASAAYVDLATVGPSFTIPNAGTYALEFSGEVYNSVSAGDEFVAPKFGAAATLDNDSFGIRVPAAGQAEAGVRKYGAVALAAATVVKLQYRTNAGTGQFRKRALQVTPLLLT